MFKKIFIVFSVSALFSTLSFATDLLAFYSNGKLTENSPGVKVLSLEEKKQVKGGYQVAFVNMQNFSSSYLSIREIAAVVLPDPINEVASGGLCGIGESSCYIPGSYEAYGKLTHYTTSKDRYNQLKYEADYNKGELLAFTVQRSVSYIIPFRPTVQYKNNAIVIGVLNNGSIYKLRNANTSNAIVRELRSRFETTMKQSMGF